MSFLTSQEVGDCEMCGFIVLFPFIILCLIQLAAIALDSQLEELEIFERKIRFAESEADPEAALKERAVAA